MAKKDINKLVPVQRQITRNGRTFMTTVYVKPRHASSSKDTTIKVPDWEFKSSTNFQDEFDRINKMRDKTARQYLKEQLLKHVEEDLGVTYDKVPDSDPRAFVKNSLRGFSAAKKHLAEGKGYAKKPDAKKPDSKPKKKKEPAKKKERKVKLPSKVAEAYDRATPTARAIATVTGIVAEDTQTEKWLLERLNNGEFDIAPSKSDALIGSKAFEQVVDNRMRKIRNSRINAGTNLGMSENLLNKYAYGLDSDIRAFTPIKEDLKRFELTHIGVDDPEVDKIVDRLESAGRDKLSVDKMIRHLDGTIYGVDRQIDSDVPLQTYEQTSAVQAEAVLGKVENLNNYYRELMDETGGALSDVTYKDVANRMLKRSETLENGDTDDIWKAFDVDKMLEAEYISPNRMLNATTPYWSRAARMRDNFTRVGGETGAILDAHLMSQTLQYEVGDRQESSKNFKTAALGVTEQYEFAVTRGISKELNDRLWRYTQDNLGMRPALSNFRQAPTMKLLNSALRADVITRDELVEIIRPGLEAISKQTAIVGSTSSYLYEDGKAGPLKEVEDIADGTASYAGNRVFMDIRYNPELADIPDGDYWRASQYFRQSYGESQAGVDPDPFRSVRQEAYHQKASKYDGSEIPEIVFDTLASKDSLLDALDQRDDLTKRTQEIQANLAENPEVKRDLLKLGAAKALSDVNRVSYASNANARHKFASGVASRKMEFPDDALLDDPRLTDEIKFRYILKYLNTPEERRPKVENELRNSIAIRTNLSSYHTPKVDAKGNPVKETKAQRFNRLKAGASARVTSMIENNETITQDKISGIEVPEPGDLLKSSVKTSIGSVSGAAYDKIADKVEKTHDNVWHGDFKPKVHGVYEIKETLNDDKYEKKFQELGGSTGEFYHGTSFNVTQKILGETGGFKVFNGGDGVKSGSMLGYGVYLADKSSKSAQYISNHGFSRSVDRGSLMIVEAALGKKKQFEYPRDVRKNHSKGNYNSIEAMTNNPTATLRNNEWLVKEADQARPKYIVDYERADK